MPRWLSLLLFLLISLLVAANTRGADDTLTRALDYLQDHRLSSDTIHPHPDFAHLKKKIAARPDPGSQFGYVIFSVARHSDKLLSAEQASQLNALIASREQHPVHWHDIRNIVRIHAVSAMWDYARADIDPARHRANWVAWTELRIAYMFEEYMAAERFHRAFLAILNADQRSKLISGEWDSFLKKSTGHKRLFSADKQVRRVMGKPDDRAAFEQASRRWHDLWRPMHKRYLAASKFQRQRQFAIDLGGEDFDVAAWQEYAKAFRAFVTMECDAVRDILQTGYEIDGRAAAKLDQNCNRLHADMIEKYRPGCSDFLRAIGSIKAD